MMPLLRLHRANSTNVRLFAVVLLGAITVLPRASLAGGPIPDDPRIALTSMRRGVAAANLGNWEHARVAFAEATRFGPDWADAFFNLGVSEAVLGRSTEAATAYRNAIRLLSSHVPARVNLAIELSRADRLDDARGLLEGATRLEPRNGLAHYNLGVVLGAQGQYGSALASLHRARQLRRGDEAIVAAVGWAHYDLGVALARHRQWTRALQEFEAARAFAGSTAEIMNASGIAQAQFGDHAAAVASYGAALERAPSFPEASYNLAVSLAALGRTDDAIRAAREALRQQPGLEPAVTLLRQLVAGMSNGTPLPDATTLARAGRPPAFLMAGAAGADRR